MEVVGVADIEFAGGIFEDVNPEHEKKIWLPMRDVLRNSDRERVDRKSSDFRGYRFRESGWWGVTMLLKTRNHGCFTVSIT
jgi:hypothetical protein